MKKIGPKKEKDKNASKYKTTLHISFRPGTMKMIKKYVTIKLPKT